MKGYAGDFVRVITKDKTVPLNKRQGGNNNGIIVDEKDGKLIVRPSGDGYLINGRVSTPYLEFEIDDVVRIEIDRLGAGGPIPAIDVKFRKSGRRTILSPKRKAIQTAAAK